MHGSKVKPSSPSFLNVRACCDVLSYAIPNAAVALVTFAQQLRPPFGTVPVPERVSPALSRHAPPDFVEEVNYQHHVTLRHARFSALHRHQDGRPERDRNSSLCPGWQAAFPTTRAASLAQTSLAGRCKFTTMIRWSSGR